MDSTDTDLMDTDKLLEEVKLVLQKMVSDKKAKHHKSVFESTQPKVSNEEMLDEYLEMRLRKAKYIQMRKSPFANLSIDD
jgi:hypothetical protein